MKEEYKIGVWETNYGTIIVEADSENEARKKANKILETDGMPEDAKICDREFGERRNSMNKKLKKIKIKDKIIKTLMFIMILFLPSFTFANFYKLGNQDFFKKSIDPIFSELIQHWCINNYVWIQYKNYKSETVSQIFIRKLHAKSTPLQCEDFKEYEKGNL